MTNASILTHTDFKVKSHGAGAYCGGHLAAQLVFVTDLLCTLCLKTPDRYD